MILAILLASVMAATLKGRRASNAVNQGNAFWLLLAWRRTEVAPFARRDRSSVLPIFEMPPN